MTIYYADASALVKHYISEMLPSKGLPKPVLLSADHDLLEAAENEGLVTEDPNSYA